VTASLSVGNASPAVLDFGPRAAADFMNSSNHAIWEVASQELHSLRIDRSRQLMAADGWAGRRSLARP